MEKALETGRVAPTPQTPSWPARMSIHIKSFYQRRPKTAILIAMSPLSLLFLLFLLLRDGGATGTTKSTGVVGYWQAQNHNTMPPASINYTYLSHLNYAFYAPDQYGYLYPNVDDGAYLLKQVVADAHAQKTQVILSIGGASGSENLTSVLASDTWSNILVSQCVALVKQYGLDGIDLDYESPTDLEETNNAIDFLVSLRSKFKHIDNNRTSTGHPLLTSILSTSSFVSDTGSMMSNLKNVSDVVDWFNVDDYDFNVSNNSTAPNSPLFGTSCNTYQKTAAVNNSITTYLAAEVPKSKLRVGIPFYSKQATAATEPYEGMSCYPMKTDDSTTTYVTYADSLTAQTGSEWVSHWDNTTRTGWVYNNSTAAFSSTNWEPAVEAKAMYTSCSGLLGVSIWSVDDDSDGVLTALAAGVTKSYSKSECEAAGYA